MVRQIIQIDEEKCTGCGLCADACHEGAIGMVNGKAKLLRDDYCDGLGNCLPACPADAISFVEREAAAYDEAAVARHMEAKKQEEKINTIKQAQAEKMEQMKKDMQEKLQAQGLHMHEGGCPGSKIRMMNQQAEDSADAMQGVPGMPPMPPFLKSQLRNWPVQIKLAPINAPYFDGAKLLIAADCTAYAYAAFHQEFMKGKVTLIGCPKLDDIDYSEKLTEIIARNEIKSVTIVRMEVPCCGGLQAAAVNALKNSGKFIPWQVVTISIDGKILDN